MTKLQFEEELRVKVESQKKKFTSRRWGCQGVKKQLSYVSFRLDQLIQINQFSEKVIESYLICDYFYLFFCDEESSKLMRKDF